MEKEFVKGLFFKKRHDNTPEFIIINGSIHLKSMIEFCTEKINQGNEYTNFDVLQPKDKSKKPYPVINNWKPSKEQSQQEDYIPF